MPLAVIFLVNSLAERLIVAGDNAYSALTSQIETEVNNLNLQQCIERTKTLIVLTRLITTFFSDGEISIKWRTIDKQAVNNRDYIGGEDVVHFKHGETNQLIKIPIIDDMEFEKDENFEIELFEPEGGAKIGKINRTAVTITNDDEFNSVLNRMLLMTNANVDSMKVHHETWAQQLKDAMNVNGGDVENASTVISIFKILDIPL